jgi:hypothetical protein
VCHTLKPGGSTQLVQRPEEALFVRQRVAAGHLLRTPFEFAADVDVKRVAGAERRYGSCGREKL